VAGDSAGGGLATPVCLMARDRGSPEIAFPLLMYPGVDRDLSLPAMTIYEFDPCSPESLHYVDDRAGAVSRCNDYLADHLSDHLDGLHPIAMLDLSDIDMTVAELGRPRRRGHRAFFLYTVNGEPLAVSRRATQSSIGHGRQRPRWEWWL
jgi:acetyl esterase/lipase